jgi:hypothetical protein
MTEDQARQFNIYGCVSRSIIKAAEIRKTPISKADFVAKYSHLFPKDQCGLLALDGFCEVVKDLGLTIRVNSTRDVSLVIHNVRHGKNAHMFALTEIHPNLVDPLGHCRLVLSHGVSQDKSLQNNEALKMFCPMNDGSDVEEWIPVDHLEKMKVHFLVLQ